MKRSTLIRVAVAGSVLASGLFASTGAAFAWDTGTCPSNVWDSHDRLCYIAYDSTNGNPTAYDWIALHVYTGSDGHDKVWTNGVSKWASADVFLIDNGTVKDYQPFGPGPFQLGKYDYYHGIQDSPGNSYTAQVYYFDSKDNVVEHLTTTPN